MVMFPNPLAGDNGTLRLSAPHFVCSEFTYAGPRPGTRVNMGANMGETLKGALTRITEIPFLDGE